MANIEGTVASELIQGTAGDDVIFGRGGNDTVFGFGGNNYIATENGNDVIYGGVGNDTIGPGHGFDVIYGGGGNDFFGYGAFPVYTDVNIFYGGTGNDQFQSGWGKSILHGIGGTDTFSISSGAVGGWFDVGKAQGSYADGNGSPATLAVNAAAHATDFSFRGSIRSNPFSPDFTGTIRTPDSVTNYEQITAIQFVDGRYTTNDGDFAAQAYRLYAAAFARTPDDNGLASHLERLTNDFLYRPGGATLTQVAEVFVASPEFQARYGTLDDTGFITQLYANVLHRAPDPGGLAAWQAGIGTIGRAGVLVGFSESAENIAVVHPVVANGLWAFDYSALQVARLYDTVLGRLPDAAGLASWNSALENSQVSLGQVAGAFVSSPEFQARYGALGNGDFVQALYINTLHRQADPAGLSAWTSALDGGLSRSDVVLGFSESPEHVILSAPAIMNHDPAYYGINFA